jgi:succinate dehydrogenase / fumarate reductase flavoprotein subunit
MLLASQVFGARAGKHAAAYASKHEGATVDSRQTKKACKQIEAFKNQAGKINPDDIKKKLQKSAYFNLLTIRNEESLTEFLNDVRGLQESLPQLAARTPQALIGSLELRNLLTLAEIEAQICLKRKESRGPHYRTDYPRQDDQNWLKSITLKKVGGKIKLDTLALDPNWTSLGDEKIGYWG